MPCTNASFALACRYAGRLATSAAAFCAAVAATEPDPGGTAEVGDPGAATADPVADTAATTAPTVSAAPTARRRLDTFTALFLPLLDA